MDAFISQFISWFNINELFLVVVLFIALYFIERTGRKYDAALKHIKELEEHLGVPLREEDLVPGAQYVHVEPPEGTIFIKRVGTTVSDPLIRAVSFDGLNAGLIMSNTVFSVIQSEDGTRMLFSKKGAIAPATVKAS